MTSLPRPVAHVSIPVHDLDAAIEFYSTLIGATTGRRTEEFVDILVLGTQLTLHDDSANVTMPMPRTRHFGWTVSWSAWEGFAARLAAEPCVVESPTVSYVGEAHEQAKLMLADPSGNLIELKAYRDPEAVLFEAAG